MQQHQASPLMISMLYININTILTSQDRIHNDPESGVKVECWCPATEAFQRQNTGGGRRGLKWSS